MPSIGFQNPINGSYGIGNTPPIINGPGGKPYLCLLYTSDAADE